MWGSPPSYLSSLGGIVGEGSAYDKHFDNSGLSDTRKVAALYYMNSHTNPY